MLRSACVATFLSCSRAAKAGGLWCPFFFQQASFFVGQQEAVTKRARSALFFFQKKSAPYLWRQPRPICSRVVAWSPCTCAVLGSGTLCCIFGRRWTQNPVLAAPLHPTPLAHAATGRPPSRHGHRQALYDHTKKQPLTTKTVRQNGMPPFFAPCATMPLFSPFVSSFPNVLSSFF